MTAFDNSDPGETLLTKVARALFAGLDKNAVNFARTYSRVCYSMLDLEGAREEYDCWRQQPVGVEFAFAAKVRQLEVEAKAFGVDMVLERYKYWHQVTKHAVDERLMMFECGFDFRLGAWMQPFEADKKRTKAKGRRVCWRNSSGKENKLTGSQSDLEDLMAKSLKELQALAKAEGVASSGRKADIADAILKIKARHHHRSKTLKAHSGSTNLAPLDDGMGYRTALTDMGLARKRKANSKKNMDTLLTEQSEGSQKKREKSFERKRRRQKKVNIACGQT